MKWVVIVKFSDGVKTVMQFDLFADACNELCKWNYDSTFFDRTPISPVKVTIEKMVVAEWV